MIDKELFKSVSDKVTDLDKKTYEISGLEDFLAQTSGMCTVRVNGRYTFQVPASLLTDYFSAKKTELEAEVATVTTQIDLEVAELGKKNKGEVLI